MSGKAGRIAAPPSARLRISLRQLEVFVATARHGSTRAAADKVARSQSAASSALVELEATLGIPLFDRVGRGLALNENGRALLAKSAALLDAAGELEQLFSGTPSTPLRVAASLTIGEILLPALVAQWKERHPASAVNVVIGNTSAVIEAVLDYDVDIGFIEGQQSHPDVVVRPWLTDEMAIIAAPAHPLAGQQRIGRALLRGADWALREPGSGTREAADRWLIGQLGQINVAYEFGSLEAIKRLLTAGTALGCLSRRAVAIELHQGRLVELNTRLPPASRRLSIVLHKDKHIGRGTEDFIAGCLALERSGSARPLP